MYFFQMLVLGLIPFIYFQPCSLASSKHFRLFMARDPPTWLTAYSYNIWLSQLPTTSMPSNGGGAQILDEVNTVEFVEVEGDLAGRVRIRQGDRYWRFSKDPIGEHGHRIGIADARVGDNDWDLFTISPTEVVRHGISAFAITATIVNAQDERVRLAATIENLNDIVMKPINYGDDKSKYVRPGTNQLFFLMYHVQQAEDINESDKYIFINKQQSSSVFTMEATPTHGACGVVQWNADKFFGDASWLNAVKSAYEGSMFHLAYKHPNGSITSAASHSGRLTPEVGTGVGQLMNIEGRSEGDDSRCNRLIDSGGESVMSLVYNNDDFVGVGKGGVEGTDHWFVFGLVGDPHAAVNISGALWPG
eukprot:GHVN01085308.1.p1 GENE.GHVN01085308.1~~GHVN01085308.1.p1  ORF type:complete len:375 (+),score=62.78 GHVN01085308.1:41-1126(+)